MIDLHTHTTESDGSLEPEALVDAAIGAGLDALAITDHDTLAGYDRAAPVAAARGLDLVPGIELSTVAHFHGRHQAIHLLAYFIDLSPPPRFRAWLEQVQEARRKRNRTLAARLQELGAAVTLEEAESLGQTQTGRPHFARLLVAKGYAKDFRDAFDTYLGERAPAYVMREEPRIEQAIEEVRLCGGLSAVAHPVRLEDEAILPDLVAMGMAGIEVFHTDHSPRDVERYLGYAERYRLAVTGGSDYHGEAKPDAVLGGALVPCEVLERLRAGLTGGCLD